MKKYKTIELVLMVVFLLVFGGCAALYAMPSKTVENTFDTGVVNISLVTYQLNENGEEELWTDKEFVTPNSTVSNIKRITNEGEHPCYIRAKVFFFETEHINRENLMGISEDWVLKEDGYYYHKEPVMSKDSVDLFNAIQIPDYVPNDQEGMTFFMSVEVDALQEQNVTPDYEAEQPWGDIVVLKAETDGQNILSSVEEYTALSITYLGETDGFIAVPEDFFSNLPVLYPGDSYTDTLELNNDSLDQIKLYFRSSTLEEEDDTLERMQMTISIEHPDGTVKELYSGSIKTEAFAEEKEIISLSPGQSGKLHFMVTMPADMDNAYILKHKSVYWTFSTEVIPEDIPNAPDTGDHTAGLIYLAGMVLSASAFVLLIIGKRRRNEVSK